MQDLIERLRALHVWPQSTADEYADTLTPRRIAALYEVGKVAHEAAEALTTAQAEIERLTKALEATRDHCPQCEGEGQYLFGPRRNQNMVPCEFCENARAALSGSQT